MLPTARRSVKAAVLDPDDLCKDGSEAGRGAGVLDGRCRRRRRLDPRGTPRDWTSRPASRSRPCGWSRSRTPPRPRCGARSTGKVHLGPLATLIRDGTVIEAGGAQDWSKAVLLMRAATADEALAIIEEDGYTLEGAWHSPTARPFGRVVVDPPSA